MLKSVPVTKILMALNELKLRQERTKNIEIKDNPDFIEGYYSALSHAIEILKINTEIDENDLQLIKK